MGEKTEIEWADNTYNPWEGCTKLTAACDYCYAAERDGRFHGGQHWGKGAPRRRTSETTRRKPFAWDKRAAMTGIRESVFSLSLGDWADPRGAAGVANRTPRTAG